MSVYDFSASGVYDEVISVKAIECVKLFSVLREKAFRMSQVNILNIMGEFTVPCCSPSLIANNSVEVCIPSQVTKDFSEIKSQIMCINHRGNSFLCSLYRSPFSHTESKAFSRSIKTAPTW